MELMEILGYRTTPGDIKFNMSYIPPKYNTIPDNILYYGKVLAVRGVPNKIDKMLEDIREINVDMDIIKHNIEEILDDENHLEAIQKSMSNIISIEFSNRLYIFIKHYISYIRTLIGDDVNKRMKEIVSDLTATIMDTDINVDIDYDLNVIVAVMHLGLSIDREQVDYFPETDDERYKEDRDYDN